MKVLETALPGINCSGGSSEVGAKQAGDKVLTRAEVETQLKQAKSEMAEAMKLKQFDKCAKIQSTIDELEAAKSKLPTKAEVSARATSLWPKHA